MSIHENIGSLNNELTTKLRHAENVPSFWEAWKGTAEDTLAHLTDDIYAYESTNNAYGEGIAIKYGTKNFWYSPSNQALFNSSNDKITSEELRASGDTVMVEQVNRLIGIALQNRAT